MAQGHGVPQGNLRVRRRQFLYMAASTFLLAAVFVMNACGANPAVVRTEAAAAMQPDQRGPTSTNSTLLYPRHYDRQRVRHSPNM